jgi:hypothetical protein
MPVAGKRLVDGKIDKEDAEKETQDHFLITYIPFHKMSFDSYQRYYGKIAGMMMIVNIGLDCSHCLRHIKLIISECSFCAGPGVRCLINC